MKTLSLCKQNVNKRVSTLNIFQVMSRQSGQWEMLRAQDSLIFASKTLPQTKKLTGCMDFKHLKLKHGWTSGYEIVFTTSPIKIKLAHVHGLE